MAQRVSQIGPPSEVVAVLRTQLPPACQNLCLGARVPSTFFFTRVRLRPCHRGRCRGLVVAAMTHMQEYRRTGLATGGPPVISRSPVLLWRAYGLVVEGSCCDVVEAARTHMLESLNFRTRSLWSPSSVALSVRLSARPSYDLVAGGLLTLSDTRGAHHRIATHTHTHTPVGGVRPRSMT